LGNACQKEQSPITPVIKTPVDTLTSHVDTLKDIIELGKCTCLKNDKNLPLTTDAWYYPDRKDVFLMSANYTDPYMRSYTVFVDDVPTKKGKYSVEAYNYNDNNFIPQMAVFVSQDHDQLIGRYYADSTRNDHYIEVISFDSLAGTVQGRFQFFTKEKNVTGPNSWGLDPKINLTQGKFHLKLQ
jgi:hypothetical protein